MIKNRYIPNLILGIVEKFIKIKYLNPILIWGNSWKMIKYWIVAKFVDKEKEASIFGGASLLSIV